MLIINKKMFIYAIHIATDVRSLVENENKLFSL